MSASNLKQSVPPTSNGISVCIRDIDPNIEKDVETITRLHTELLDWGPMAQLGKLFLKKICYTVLLKDNLMKVALCEIDGNPAGFIAYSEKSFNFYKLAIKKHLLYVIYLLILSVILHPWIVLHLPRAVYLMLSRRPEETFQQDPQAEILAIGVRQEYRNPVFIRKTGLQISRDLVDYAASYFKSIGLKKMHLIVDADNRPAIIFYHTLGGKFEPYKLAGIPSYLIWFDL